MQEQLQAVLLKKASTLSPTVATSNAVPAPSGASQTQYQAPPVAMPNELQDLSDRVKDRLNLLGITGLAQGLGASEEDPTLVNYLGKLAKPKSAADWQNLLAHRS